MKILLKAFGRTLQEQAMNEESFIGKTMKEDDAAIQKQQNAIFERENAIEIHEANRQNLHDAQKEREELRTLQHKELSDAAEARFAEIEDKKKAHEQTMKYLEENGASQTLLKNKEDAFIEAKLAAEQEYNKKRNELLELQKEQMESANTKVTEMAAETNKSVGGFLKKQAENQKGPLGKLASKATTTFGDFGKSIKGLKGLKSGALSGAMDAFQQGKGIKDIAASAIQGGVGKMAGTALTGALTPVLGPFAPFVGQFLGGKVGAFAGKALGSLFGGKAVKPKSAQKKIKDVIVGNLIGVTTPGMQLSKNFAEGSAAHKVVKANIAIAGSKNPDKLFKDVSDAVFAASGIRYSNQKHNPLFKHYTVKKYRVRQEVMNLISMNKRWKEAYNVVVRLALSLVGLLLLL